MNCYTPLQPYDESLHTNAPHRTLPMNFIGSLLFCLSVMVTGSSQALSAKHEPDRSPEKRPALRVLVVDDDRDTVLILKALLESEGFVVHAAHSGTEATRVAHIVRPDAIVMDISIPGISGYGVAQSIRLGYAGPRRPVLIAMSGVWKERPDQAIARQAGFDHYLEKPANPLRLLSILKQIDGNSP
jgi:CheY-like chemotaxis protein